VREQEVQNALRALRGLPAQVLAWKVEAGSDAAGDDAVWVWATLRDVDLTDENRREIRNRVKSAIRDMGAEHPPWAYVRFPGESEQRAAG